MISATSSDTCTRILKEREDSLFSSFNERKVKGGEPLDASGVQSKMIRPFISCSMRCRKWRELRSFTFRVELSIRIFFIFFFHLKRECVNQAKKVQSRCIGSRPEFFLPAGPFTKNKIPSLKSSPLFFTQNGRARIELEVNFQSGWGLKGGDGLISKLPTVKRRIERECQLARSIFARQHKLLWWRQMCIRIAHSPPLHSTSIAVHRRGEALTSD